MANHNGDSRMDSRQTAYDEDQGKHVRSTGESMHGWNDRIIQLYSSGYRFLGLRFSESDYLFRGASSGLKDFVVNDYFGHYHGDRSVTALEQQLDIYFVTQDLSDAYTVARFWEITNDSFIAVLKSNVFNVELDHGRAAVLGFAEPGVVFKYPFLTRPLSVVEIEYLIISPDDYRAISYELDETTGKSETEFATAIQKWKTRGYLSKFIVPKIDVNSCLSRSDYEKAMLRTVVECGISSAKPEPTRYYPSAKN